MDIGQPVRIIEVPRPTEQPKRVPSEQPRRDEEQPIEVPNWPVRKPVEIPQES